MHLVGKCEDCGEIVHFSLSTNIPPVRRYEDDNLLGERYAFSTVNERVEIITLNHRISDLADLSKYNPIEIIRIVKGLRKKGA